VPPRKKRPSSAKLRRALAQVRAFRARYNADLPARLFKTKEEAVACLKSKRREFHKITTRYVKNALRRLPIDFVHIEEIYAVAGARADGLSIAPKIELCWEFFGTVGRVEEDLRKLERDSSATPIAVVLDHEVAPKLFERFQRSLRGSSVKHWFRATDFMTVASHDDTVARLTEIVASALGQSARVPAVKCLALSLASGLQCWEEVEDAAYTFHGLRETPNWDLEDPVFNVDLRNETDLEEVITGTFINVRYRQIVLHGLPGDRLVPAASISLPLNNGEIGYRVVHINPPLRLPPGHYCRLEVLLREAGFGWRGDIDIGFILGSGQRVLAPTLTILL